MDRPHLLSEEFEQDLLVDLVLEDAAINEMIDLLSNI